MAGWDIQSQQMKFSTTVVSLAVETIKNRWINPMVMPLSMLFATKPSTTLSKTVGTHFDDRNVVSHQRV